MCYCERCGNSDCCERLNLPEEPVLCDRCYELVKGGGGMLTKGQAISLVEMFDFFQGQRAGRELWNDKPFEIQEKDIENFSRGCHQLIEYIKNCTKTMPAVETETEEVRYAEWAYSATQRRIVCTRCRTPRPFKKVKGKEHFSTWHSKRCPECGAIMKEKERKNQEDNIRKEKEK